MTKSREQKLAYSVPEAAEQLGIGRGLLYELMNAGEVQYFHIGKRRLISRDALILYVQSKVA